MTTMPSTSNPVAAGAAAAASPETSGATPSSTNSSNNNSGGASGNNVPMTSLYVGDLHPDVTEAMLYEKFSSIGPVLSIRVCRDMVSRKSLGYAYVNFQNPAHAETAMDNMNFDRIRGRPIRIMWSQRDPSLRKSGQGNIFIKNLDKDIDQKNFYDTFFAFGNILSCKIAMDESGKSKGYGFVHFESNESASEAIESINGMLIKEKTVFVGHFIPKGQRTNSDTHSKFTNVFIKNFGEEWDDDKLRAKFEEVGEIVSAKVMLDDKTGKSKGFGFVCFKEPRHAEEAVQKFNSTPLEDLSGASSNDANSDGTGSQAGKLIYVGRAQKRSERQEELKRRHDKQRTERTSRYASGVNLYVKNMDDSIGDEQLKKEFEQFGNITSAKVMFDANNRSKGFGFVCFANPEQATKAVTEMNGKICGSKPLYVALAQRKEDRQAHLSNQFMQRIAQYRNHPQMVAGHLPAHHSAAGGAIHGAVHPHAAAHAMGATAAHNNPQLQAAIAAMNANPAAGLNAAAGPGINPMHFNQFSQQSHLRLAQMTQQHQQQQATFGRQQLAAQQLAMANSGGPVAGQQFPQNRWAQNQAAAHLAGAGGQRFMNNQQPYGAQNAAQDPANLFRLQQANYLAGNMQPNAQFMQQARAATSQQQQQAGGRPITAGSAAAGAVNQKPFTMASVVAGAGQQPQQQPPQQQARNVVNQKQRFNNQTGQSAAGAQQPAASILPLLSESSMQDQKQILGEKLFPCVQKKCQSNAGKITGMLLDIDNSELLHMLETPELLDTRIEEAISVLESHNKVPLSATAENDSPITAGDKGTNRPNASGDSAVSKDVAGGTEQ